MGFTDEGGLLPQAKKATEPADERGVSRALDHLERSVTELTKVTGVLDERLESLRVPGEVKAVPHSEMPQNQVSAHTYALFALAERVDDQVRTLSSLILELDL